MINITSEQFNVIQTVIREHREERVHPEELVSLIVKDFEDGSIDVEYTFDNGLGPAHNITKYGTQVRPPRELG